MAALYASEGGADVAVVSKLHPLRSPHGRGAGRHRRGARQRGGGPLALARLRHHQGLGLPGRPGRHRADVPGRPAHDHRARALRRPVQPDARGQDRPAPVRRAHPQLRRGAGAAGLLRGRPDGPHDPAHALRAVRQEQGHVLRRVPGPGPHPPGRHPGRGLGLRRLRDPDRRGPHVPQHDHVLRDGRLRPRLQDDLATRTPGPATGSRSRSATASRWRTWSSSSSTRRACTAWAS